MYKLLLALLLIVSVTLINAQTKDLSQKPTSFNNPEYVYGPELNYPLSSLNESFEGTTFPPAGWTKASPDGGTGWQRIVAGTTPVPGFNGGTIIPITGGGTAMAFCAYGTGGATTSDQWLFTPQLTNVQPNDSLTFWLRKFGTYIDNMHIRISTTTATPSAATIVVDNHAFTVADSGWVQFKYRIGNLVPAGSNIYIGFRNYTANNQVDGASFCLDLVSVIAAPVPVELTSFTANTNGTTVQLNWATATETNNRGFEIQKKSANGQFVNVGFVNGKGTTTQAQNYSFNDKVDPGTYTYRLRQVDLNGNSDITKSVEVTVNPSKFELGNNYPNPFNPSTKISFTLSVDSKVSLRVYNLLGQQVASLVNGNLVAGTHQINFNASNLSTGVYMYKLEASGIDGQSFTSVKKMILNK